MLHIIVIFLLKQLCSIGVISIMT